jgi:hypothetical protein
MQTKLCITGLLLALNLSARGSLAIIPDNSTIGLTEVQTVGGMGASISQVTLTLVLQGGFASDLQGYLRLGNLAGSTACNLTSLIQGQTLSESTPTSYTIDVTTTFAGQNPNNTWTLFFADTSPGGVTTLDSWNLAIEAVPEPVTMALPIFGALVLTTGLVRRFISRRTDRVV